MHACIKALTSVYRPLFGGFALWFRMYVSVNNSLSLLYNYWLHLKAISFLDMHSIGQDLRAINYIRLKYVQSAR